VLIITGSAEAQTSSLDVDRLLLELSDRLPGKEAAKIAAKVTGTKRNDLYRRILELKGDD